MAALAALGIERVEAMDDALLSIVSDRAGIDKDGVGFSLRLGDIIVGHLHDGGHSLAVGHVHLASVSFYIEFFHAALE